MAINLALVGFLLLLTPVFMAFRNGVKEPDDLARWVMDQPDPWRFQMKLYAMIIFGLSLMLFGGMWSLFP